jgi:hypothetical protein
MKNRGTVIIFCLALLMGSVRPTTAAEKRRVDVKPRITSQSAAISEFETGKLIVKSNVEGPKVYIAGTYRGEAPISAMLKSGVYSIVLKKAGYSDTADDRGDAGSVAAGNGEQSVPFQRLRRRLPRGECFLERCPGLYRTAKPAGRDGQI